MTGTNVDHNVYWNSLIIDKTLIFLSVFFFTKDKVLDTTAADFEGDALPIGI